MCIMISLYRCPSLPSALTQLKECVALNESSGKRTVIFCEDRLSLAAERTVCAAVGGSFTASVYTFPRFLAVEKGKPAAILSAQGSAMAVRRIMEERSGDLTVFKCMNASDAAQSVYDTIALLLSSGVSPEEVAGAAKAGGLLGGKLKDLSLIYSEYLAFIEKSGKTDRNGYLLNLAPAAQNSKLLKGASVIFFAFQAFTSATRGCISATMSVADDVSGIFIGGNEDIYVNEAETSFLKASGDFGGAKVFTLPSNMCPEAEKLRTGLYDPSGFYGSPMPTGNVYLFSAADEIEEFEYIAANIKKHVLDDGIKYGDISVMLPDIDDSERKLSRVFAGYKIPYYADRRIPLAEHPLCSFILSYLTCVLTGCRRDVEAVVFSPYFGAEKNDKEEFGNYLLRFASYRGGVRKQPDSELLAKFSKDAEAIERVRTKFLGGLTLVSGAKGENSDIFGGIKQLLNDFAVGEKLKDMSNRYADCYPVHAAFGARALDAVFSVVDEAAELCAGLDLKTVIKILKSGFAAMKISLIPPKADAVFVGDLCATANTGSKIVFAARLTEDAPRSGDDTALITDREMDFLMRTGVDVSPKIRQVNLRCRETAALNVCAFSQKLYLSYPLQGDGGECAPSEIISYARALFLSPSGAPLVPVDMRRISRTGRALPYFCSERTPALKQLFRTGAGPQALAAVYKTLCAHGLKEEADAAMAGRKRENLTCGKELYINYGSVTPTALESYFSCPFMGFMKQGLKVGEREEGAVRPVDTGNFIHSVLQELAPMAASVPNEDEFALRAQKLALKKLGEPPYSSLADLKSGKFTAARLVDEAKEIAAGMYRQLAVSSFGVEDAELELKIPLSGGINIYGKTDRVDSCGDMVRIIDYKTGAVDCSPAKYYLGRKLQLPLYLLAASKGRRPVGAYYFPASVEFGDKPARTFRLEGFMDGGDDVVWASDNTVKEGAKSEYFDAYLKGRKIDSAMDSESFNYFLGYSLLVADGGVKEMISGNVKPSPAEGACAYCKMGGSCGFLAGRDGGERKTGAVKCSQIASIVKGEKGDE